LPPGGSTLCDGMTSPGPLAACFLAGPVGTPWCSPAGLPSLGWNGWTTGIFTRIGHSPAVITTLWVLRNKLLEDG
jgi:hypothetical protein